MSPLRLLRGEGMLRASGLLAGRAGPGPAPLARPIKQICPPFNVAVESAAQPIDLPALVGASEQVVRKLTGELEIWMLIDDSASMWAWNADRQLVRYAAARSLLRCVAKTGKDATAGVIHWGATAPDRLVTGPLNIRKQRPGLGRALTVSECLGGTEVTCALRQAAAHSTHQPHRRRIYFVLTDGIAEVASEVHDALEALPAESVHMLLVDRSHGCDPLTETAWRRAAFASFVRLESFDRRAMAVQLASTVAESLGLALASGEDNAQATVDA